MDQNTHNNTCKNAKAGVINIARKFFTMLNNLQQMRLKLLQKEQFRRQQKQLVI